MDSSQRELLLLLFSLTMHIIVTVLTFHVYQCYLPQFKPSVVNCVWCVYVLSQCCVYTV